MPWIAAATAVAVGVASFPFRRYSYWSTWNGGWLAVAAALYLAIQSISGLVGAALAGATEWTPTDSLVLDGVLFGIAGAALLRVHLEDFGIGDANRANTMLRLFVGRIVDWMDSLAEKRLEGYLDGLEDRDLVLLITRVDHSYVRLRATPPQLSRFSKHVKKALTDMRQSNSETARFGREVIRGILVEWYTQADGTWRLEPGAREKTSSQEP